VKEPEEPFSEARLGRLETLGAWLGVWTPPKGAVVPPFPRRRAAVGGVVLAAAIAAAGVVAIPRIDDAKSKSAAAERRALAERRAAERRRLEAEQVAVRGRAAKPAGRLTRVEKLSARRALLRKVEGAIATDARRRVRAGAMTGRILRAECAPSPGIQERGGERDLRVPRSGYDCLAVTRDIPATGTNTSGRLGHPFRAVLDFRRFTFAFCKTNPPAGERAVPDPRVTPPLPPACSAP